MSGSAARVREWLDNNKIFFEVGGLLLFGGLGLYLSFQANRFTSLQTKLAAIDHLPALQFRRILSDDDGDGYLEADRLQITNEGYFLSEFAVSSAVVLEVARTGRGGGLDTILLPLHDYYNSTFITGQSKGELATLTGFHNNRNLALMELALPRHFVGWKGGHLATSTQTLLKCTYKDAQGLQHTDWFLVDPVRGTRLVSDDHARPYWTAWQNSFSGSQPFVPIADTLADILWVEARRGMPGFNE